MIAAPVCGQEIGNIKEFLERCPTNDPYYQQLRADFTLRRNDVLVGTVSCTEPISQLPIAAYTDELIVLQGLRTIRYMDWGSLGHLPWTAGSLYDWMRSKIDGINIKGSGSYCCETIGGKLYMVVREQDEFNRDFDRRWKGIAGNIDLYAHETRHVDGYGHSSCCGIPGGCDQRFDLNNLSPYGIQWMLNYLWLTGGINVGISCGSPAEVSDIANWHLSSLDSQFRQRFCSDPPPLIGTAPTPTGGACPNRALPSAAVSLDRTVYSQNQKLNLFLNLIPAATARTVDVYLAIQAGGAYYFIEKNGAVTTSVTAFETQKTLSVSELLLVYKDLPVAGVAPGVYSFLTGLVDPSTGSLIGTVSSFSFSILAR